MTDYQAFLDELDRGTDARTFGTNVRTAIKYLEDKECPAEVKVILGNWFFRRIATNSRPDEERRRIARPLLAAIRRVNLISLKGLYLNYTDTRATGLLAKQFWVKRFPEKYFVVQLVNDQQLIKNYLNDPDIDDETLITHFLRWADRSDVETQKSDLLDVLLRYYGRDERVVAYHDRLRYGGGKVRNIYTNAQSTHDEDISDASLRAADALVGWAADNPIPASELDAVRGNFNAWIIARLPAEVFGKTSYRSLASKVVSGADDEYQETYLDVILNRMTTDQTTFGDGAFNATDVAMSAIHYIRRLPEDQQAARWVMLKEEMMGMAGLCISRYVAGFVNALQGCDPAFSITIPESKRIEAIVTTKFGLALREASDKIIEGSYSQDPAKARAYAEACESYLNSVLDRLEQVDRDELAASIVAIAESATGIEAWTYSPEGGPYGRLSLAGSHKDVASS